jgi:polar amino acid transport system ATP-binding protein
MSLLRAENLWKQYAGRPVLRGIDLEVAAHQVLCVIGTSGSGKSTLLRCLNLLEPVDDGAIWLDGQEITDPRVEVDRVRRRIGIVFQAYNLFPHLSVLDNITLAPRKVHGVGRAEATRRARELLDRFGWPARPTTTPTGSPADSSSGRRSYGPWRRTRR